MDEPLWLSGSDSGSVGRSVGWLIGLSFFPIRAEGSMLLLLLVFLCNLGSAARGPGTRDDCQVDNGHLDPAKGISCTAY